MPNATCYGIKDRIATLLLSCTIFNDFWWQTAADDGFKGSNGRPLTSLPSYSAMSSAVKILGRGSPGLKSNSRSLSLYSLETKQTHEQSKRKKHETSRTRLRRQ